MTLKLKDICEIDWGNTSLTKKAYEVDGEYLAVSATGADGKISHYEHEDDVCVLSAIGAQCGKMFFPQQRFTAIKNTITLTPKRELVNSKYLYHLFTHIKLPKRGAAQPFISKGDIEKFELPHLPSLAEQERIVAKLDAAFAEIDEAVAVTTKNIETVEFLFQKSLDKIFCNPSLKFIELDEACSIIGGGTPSKKNKSFYVGKVPWATVRDMKSDYISNTEFKITNDAIKKSSTNVIPSGNVVIATRVGLGKICIVEEDTAINQDLKGIIPKNTELLDTDFLFFWFKSISKKIINAGTGATVQGVKLPFIKSLKIPDIDITSQKKLASSAKFISKQSELLARIYNKKSNDLAVLKAAILKQELQPSEAA